MVNKVLVTGKTVIKVEIDPLDFLESLCLPGNNTGNIREINGIPYLYIDNSIGSHEYEQIIRPLDNEEYAAYKAVQTLKAYLRNQQKQ